VRVAGGWLMSSWDLWCRFVAGVVVVGRNGYAAEVGGEVGYAAEVVEDNWRWVVARCGLCIPLPKHVGRSLLWHPKSRSRTLDGGSAVEAVHQLG
jgi:hypothetical protein